MGGGVGGIIGSKYKMGGEGLISVVLLLLLPPPTLVVVSTIISLPSISGPSSPGSLSLSLLLSILSLFYHGPRYR
jgi:hypothetical protein